MKSSQLPSLKLGVFLTAWQLAFMVNVHAHAAQVPDNPQSPIRFVPPPAFRLPPPPTPWFLQADTNLDLLSTNEEEFKVGAAPDVFAISLVGEIKDVKSKLLQPNADPDWRGMREHLLKNLRGQLADHRATVLANQASVEALRSNPRTAWMNRPDPVQQLLVSAVKRNERMLADPSLDPNTRSAFERMLEDSKQKLADHKTNSELWRTLHLARESRDVEKTTRAENELANYLAARLGRIQGKTYSQGMSLKAIMEEYQKQEKGSHWLDRRKVIRMVIFTVLLLPPLVMVSMAIKRRGSR